MLGKPSCLRVFSPLPPRQQPRMRILEYRDGDVLMFGPESVGLPADVQQDEHITERVKNPHDSWAPLP